RASVRPLGAASRIVRRIRRWRRSPTTTPSDRSKSSKPIRYWIRTTKPPNSASNSSRVRSGNAYSKSPVFPDGNRVRQRPHRDRHLRIRMERTVESGFESQLARNLTSALAEVGLVGEQRLGGGHQHPYRLETESLHVAGGESNTIGIETGPIDLFDQCVEFVLARR